MREGIIAVAAALLAFAAAPIATAAVSDAGTVEAAELVQGSSAAGSGGGVIAGNAGGYLSCPPGKRALTGRAFWFEAGQLASLTSSTVTTRALTGGAYFHPAAEGPKESMVPSVIGGSSPTFDVEGWYAYARHSEGAPNALTTVIHCLEP